MTEEERARKKKQLRLLQLQDEDLALEQRQLELESTDEGVSGLESFGRGAAEGLTLGTAPHIAEYLGLEEDSVEKFREAEEANPGAYNTGDYGTSIAAALLTGGASAPAQLAGRGMAMGLGKIGAKGLAKKAASVAAPKSIGGMATLGAVEGAIEGAARSESDDLAGRLEDAAFGGTIGAVAPKAFDLAGKGVRGVGRVGADVGKFAGRVAAHGVGKFTPAGTGVVSESLRNVVKKSAIRGGVSPEVAQTYEDLLGDRKRLKEALGAESTYRADAKGLQKAVENFRDKAKETVDRRYVKLKRKATGAMAKEYPQILGRSKEVIQNSFNATKEFEDQYTDNTRKVLKQTWQILSGKTRLSDGTANSITEHLVEARRHLDININFAKREKLNLDEKLLRDTRNSLDNIYKEVPELQAADEFWKTYKNEARPFLDSFTGRGKNAERIRTHSVDKWVRDAGGAGALERDALRRGFQGFVENNPGMKGLTKGDLKAFEKKFQKYRDAQDIRSLVDQSGGRTGKNLASNRVAGFLTAGPIGVAITSILQPANDPAGYLKSVQTVRDWIAKTDPATVRKELGPMYQQVLDALRVGTVRGAIKGDLYNQNFDFGEGSTIRPRGQ